MTGEKIFSGIMMVLCGFGCGALFWWLGSWAAKRKDPMHFWTGSTVDPKIISDVPAYNQANSRMWKRYSIPYWLSGVLGILAFFDERLLQLAVVSIGFASTVGILWLICTYKKIEKQYKIQ